MDSQQHVNVLRVQLLGMAKLSQRALDSSIKGYELGITDFSADARTGVRSMEEYCGQIKILCRHLSTAATTGPLDARFVMAASRLNCALLAIHTAAVQIAHDTMQFLESNRMEKCEALDRFGELVNGLVRLCVVALFEKDAAHAKAVLRSQRVWRRCELIFHDVYNGAHAQMAALDVFALAIARSLGTVAKQAHEMAAAIFFWLRQDDDTLALEGDTERYGMPMLLQEFQCDE